MLLIYKEMTVSVSLLPTQRHSEQQAKQIIKALQQELDDVKHSFSNTTISNKKVFVLDESE